MKTKKILALALAAVLLVAVSVGGTLAYLQAQTENVVNTFAPSNVGVELEETGTDADGNKQYQFIPGVNLSKDPKVTVTNDVTAYVFVKVVQAGVWPTANVSYDIADGWLELDGVENVYYREVAKNATEKEFYVLKDNQVVVSPDLTNAQMEDMYAEGAEAATLTFTAYAMQKEPFTSAEAAWEAAKFQ